MMHPVDYKPSQDFGDNPTKHLPVTHLIIQTFGNYQPDGHTGIDYPCPVGTGVRAAADGVVLHVGRLGGTYADNPWWIAPAFAGFVYVVDHGHFIGIYGHCMEGGARVSAGQRVAEGQVLGLSGNTGASTGPHLHFECLPDGYILNSVHYGRINPHSLFGSLTYAGSTIKALEWDEMASKEDIKAALFEVLEHAVDRQDGNGKASLLGIVRVFDQRLNELPGRILDEPINRGGAAFGGQGGHTSLRGVAAYADQKHFEQLDAAVAAARADGASIEDIIKAVRAALASGVKVDATVKVGE